ncbi:MAG: DUF2169 domain-containing protein [Byssovorax sp.]
MDFDRICERRSWMTVRCLPMEDHRGAPVVVVVAKMAYRVSPRGAVRVSVAPVRQHSVPGGPRGSVRYPSDYVFEKPGTDVLLVGTATPPADRPVTEMDVSLRVGLLDKALRVYGPRVFYQGVLGVAPGPPGRLEPTPLIWELAYGGRDESITDRWAVEPRNPIGMGFAVDRNRLIGTLAPPIEEARSPLSGPRAAPGGFGPIGPDFEPRQRYAGTFDERWRRERAPVLPADFDVRHNSVAPPGLWSATPLLGNEPVEVIGATPEGVWRFKLPPYEPSFASVIQGVRKEHETHLDTFLIDADERTVELTWRVCIPLPKKAERVEKLEVQTTMTLPESVTGDSPLQAQGERQQETELLEART